MKYAVISDIHGNYPALKAVMKNIKQRKVNKILNAGDHLFGPLNPAETAEYLISPDIEMVSISGNQDRYILESMDEGNLDPTREFVLEKLSDSHIDWLKSLENTAIIDDDIFMCHGTPDSDAVFLLENTDYGHAELKSYNEMKELLGDVNSPVVICGHSHYPRNICYSGTLFLNPGSVGLPAYKAKEDYVFRMVSGNPAAKYAILEKKMGRWIAEIIEVYYDHDAVAEIAKENGRDDWEEWIRTGMA